MIFLNNKFHYLLVKSFLSRTCECWGVRTVYTASWCRGHAISSSCMIHVMTLPWNLPASFPTFCVCRDFVVGVRWLGASPPPPNPHHPPPPQKVKLGGGRGEGLIKRKHGELSCTKAIFTWISIELATLCTYVYNISVYKTELGTRDNFRDNLTPLKGQYRLSHFRKN